MNAQKQQSSVGCAGQLELVVEDGDYQIGRHRDPYLGLFGDGTCAVVMLDLQVPLDPTEQLDAPSHLVKHDHGKGGDLQVIRQEDEFLGGFHVVEFDPSLKDSKQRRPPAFMAQITLNTAVEGQIPHIEACL